MDTKEQVQQLYNNARLDYQPEAYYTYRPKLDGSGTALKLNLRVVPVTEEGDGSIYVKDVDGGLFLDLAGQKGAVAKGTNPTFDWQGSNRVTAKLGMVDVTSWLFALRHFRQTQGMLAFEKRALPPSLQNNREPDLAKAKKQLVLFHKFKTSTTAITISFDAEGSTLAISKPPATKGGKPTRKVIGLSLIEEVAVERYLQMALDAFLRVGMR